MGFTDFLELQAVFMNIELSQLQQCLAGVTHTIWLDELAVQTAFTAAATVCSTACSLLLSMDSFVGTHAATLK